MALTQAGMMVRAHDLDGFLLSLFAPADKRPYLWSLFAFHYEIAKTREVVSETSLGLIRLQWWRDVLEKGDADAHQILPDLFEAIQRFDLPVSYLTDLIYAREFDLEDVAPASLDGLTHYADFTTTPLNTLALGILEQEEGTEKIKDLSTAYQLTKLILAVPYHYKQGRCYLPANLMKERNINRDTLAREENRENLQAVVLRVFEVAETLWAQTSVKTPYMKTLRSLCRIYQKKIKNVHGDVFSPSFQKPVAFRELRVLFGRL